MALVICKECGKEISEKARSCPHCGARGLRATGVSEGQRVLGFFILIIGIIVLIMAIQIYIQLDQFLVVCVFYLGFILCLQNQKNINNYRLLFQNLAKQIDLLMKFSADLI